MRYEEITLTIPVEDEGQDPAAWDWQTLIDSQHPVYVEMLRKPGSRDEKFIFLRGNVSEGYRAIGPYESFEDCCDAHDGEDGWVMEINKNEEN